METHKATIRRKRDDYRGRVVKATITDGVRYGEYINIDYRQDYTEYLKQQGLLVYACNWHPKGDPRVTWYIQGTPTALLQAVARGKAFNRTKRDGRKNFFTWRAKKYDEVYLAKECYDPNYSTCDFATFMTALPETYGKTKED